MIGSRIHGMIFWRRQGRRLATLALLAACLILFVAGCHALPGPVRNLPGKIGLRSQESELRAKVEADKFPTAKEAGL